MTTQGSHPACLVSGIDLSLAVIHSVSVVVSATGALASCSRARDTR